MAVVSCPECSKKLKIADASVGKKVKCSCGNVFVAELEDDIPVRPPGKLTAAVAEKVFVACTECSAKLKVATTSLGKKMKCPKCASVFMAALADEEELEAPPIKKPVKAAPKQAETPKAKGKPAKSDDDDALFAFAQAETEAGEQDLDSEDSFEDDAPKPKAKSKFQPKGKAKPPRPMEDDGEDDSPRKKKPGSQEKGAGKVVYPRRTFLNIFVFLILLSYIGIFVVCVPELNLIKLDDLNFLPDFIKPQPVAKTPPRPFRPGAGDVTPAPGEEKKTKELSQEEFFLARQEEEKKWLEEIRKTVAPTNIPGVLAFLRSEKPSWDLFAFSAADPIMASVSSNGKEGIILWDLTTTKPKKVIGAKIQSFPVVRFSPDGQLLALLDAKEEAVKIWKVADGSQVKVLPIKEVLHDLAFSPDGKQLMVTSQFAQKVTLWNTTSWKESTFGGKPDPSICYLLSPYGNKIIELNSTKKQITSHNSTGGPGTPVKYEGSMPHFDPTVTGVSPNGRYIAHRTNNDDQKQLELIDLASGDVSELFSVKGGNIFFPRFTPDNKYVAYQSKDEQEKDQTKLFDLTEKKEGPALQGLEPWSSLNFSPGGVFVACRDQDTLVIRLLSFEDMISGKKVEEKKKDNNTTPEDKKDTKLDNKKKIDDPKIDPKKKDEPKVEPKKDDDTKVDEKKDTTPDLKDKKKDAPEKVEPKKKDDKKVDDGKVEEKKDDAPGVEPKKKDEKKVEPKKDADDPEATVFESERVFHLGSATLECCFREELSSAKREQGWALPQRNFQG